MANGIYYLCGGTLQCIGLMVGWVEGERMESHRRSGRALCTDNHDAGEGDQLPTVRGTQAFASFCFKNLKL